MNVLFYSPAFYPSVGGVESVAAMVAGGLAAAGCCVRVVTTTAGGDDVSPFPYEVIRSPSPGELLALLRWSDVFFHHNVSLKGIWPLFIVRRPWVVAHHNWYARSNGTTGWQDRLKLFAARFAENIAVSSAVAGHLGVPCSVIPNPYRDDLFRELADVPRDRDLVFLGRLVSDKGCDLLLKALGLLAGKGIRPSLTVIGSGPEEESLRDLTLQLGISEQVRFTGRLSGEELVRLLNRHAVMVVPSIVREGFGIVVLEGLACGCTVIASDSGGLNEALGECGVRFPVGDVPALAERIATLLGNMELLLGYRSEAPKHLAAHRLSNVVGRYHSLLERVNGKRNEA